MRNIIQDLARDFPATRFIVTARLAGYRGAQLDDRFSLVYVRDLDESQRAQLVRAIYRGLAFPDFEDRAGDLIARFEESATLAELGRTPVMIWTAAVIHALRGQLPEGRAALYNAYVDILLRHSFKRAQYETEALAELVEGSDWSLGDRQRYLTYAAFQVHRRLETQPEQRGERRPAVDETTLAHDILGAYFFQEGLKEKKPQARQMAREFISLMVAHSGLLYETPEGYTIGDHLTMQEFLAGCYLSKDFQYDDPDGYADFLARNVSQSWWREVFLLAVGYLADDDRNSKAAQRLLQDIARQGETPPAQLAALSLAAQALLQLRLRRQRPAWFPAQARRLANPLYHLLYAQPANAPAALRYEAGLALGWLYADDDLPDPRFAGRLGLPEFVKLAAGWFWLGSTEAEVARLIKQTDQDDWKDELPRHRVYLDAFELARYPTTNAMFARFIEAGGYRDEQWWVEAIADDRWQDGVVKDYWGERSQPEYWDDARFNNPAQPVVGVTWYEAAYCRWLTAALADGYIYRLPTEAEWERAARGGEGYGYPWGNTWQASQCNSRETGLGTTTPVGIFPAGATVDGLHDLAGNVWGWCYDWYGEDYYAALKDAINPTGPAQGQYRVLRGGSWYNDGEQMCRCGSRGWRILPYGRIGNWGFRCARTLS
jgi:formylglycine-generating enzyme required for sulfatase activity